MFKVLSRFRKSGNDRQSVRLPERNDESDTATPIIESNSPLQATNHPTEFNIRHDRNVTSTDAQSVHSADLLAPPPTSPEDNRKLTTEYLTIVMSSMYAVLLFILGNVLYMGNSFIDQSVSHIYAIFLCSVGFVYIIFLMFDINRYKSIALKNQISKSSYAEKVSEYYRQQEDEYNSSNEMTPAIQTPDGYRPHGVPSPVLIPLKHQYCFSHGRHSECFYLKLGAAVFAMGHLIHSMLLIAVQVSFITDDNVDNEECLDVLQIILDVMFPCYSFLQLYFIFKYSNVIILRAQGLARFAFMHMIASSLCFWVSAISRETLLALKIYANSVYGNGQYGSNATRKDEIDPYHAKNVKSSLVNISALYNEKCIGSKQVNTIIENFSPYLYPFSVEFNILIVAFYYIIWTHIGNCHGKDRNSDENSFDDHTICQIPTANEENDFTSSMVIHADCHASNRGLFAGIVLTVFVIGKLIIEYVFNSTGGDLLEQGYALNNSLKLTLHTVMLISVVFAFNQLRKLDINKHPMSLLDDILLFICLPAFFLETVLSLIATINILNVVKSIDLIIMVIQVIIQTPMIMDGLRRCSNSKKLRRNKPGRELLMFLLIANVSMWLFNTFSYKSPASLDERYKFYGKVLWTILGHVSLPLIMFYRFHSSVCIADIWDAAYKPGSDH